jgi:hypothetical protein
MGDRIVDPADDRPPWYKILRRKGEEQKKRRRLVSSPVSCSLGCSRSTQTVRIIIGGKC